MKKTQKKHLLEEDTGEKMHGRTKAKCCLEKHLIINVRGTWLEWREFPIIFGLSLQRKGSQEAETKYWLTLHWGGIDIYDWN
ncbi:hypothetical protein XENTR_v10018869 [Xenopus tropicalis]|nr:hypothetical protein XENTR_v10018869 [Xenopus tropicalis]